MNTDKPNQSNRVAFDSHMIQSDAFTDTEGMCIRSHSLDSPTFRMIVAHAIVAELAKWKPFSEEDRIHFSIVIRECIEQVIDHSDEWLLNACEGLFKAVQQRRALGR